MKANPDAIVELFARGDPEKAKELFGELGERVVNRPKNAGVSREEYEERRKKASNQNAFDAYVDVLGRMPTNAELENFKGYNYTRSTQLLSSSEEALKKRVDPLAWGNTYVNPEKLKPRQAKYNEYFKETHGRAMTAQELRLWSGDTHSPETAREQWRGNIRGVVEPEDQEAYDKDPENYTGKYRSYGIVNEEAVRNIGIDELRKLSGESKQGVKWSLPDKVTIDCVDKEVKLGKYWQKQQIKDADGNPTGMTYYGGTPKRSDGVVGWVDDTLGTSLSKQIPKEIYGAMHAIAAIPGVGAGSGMAANIMGGTRASEEGQRFWKNFGDVAGDDLANLGQDMKAINEVAAKTALQAAALATAQAWAIPLIEVGYQGLKGLEQEMVAPGTVDWGTVAQKATISAVVSIATAGASTGWQMVGSAVEAGAHSYIDTGNASYALRDAAWGAANVYTRGASNILKNEIDMKARYADSVAEGKMTQDQADAMLKRGRYSALAQAASSAYGRYKQGGNWSYTLMGHGSFEGADGKPQSTGWGVDWSRAPASTPYTRGREMLGRLDTPQGATAAAREGDLAGQIAMMPSYDASGQPTPDVATPGATVDLWAREASQAYEAGSPGRLIWNDFRNNYTSGFRTTGSLMSGAWDRLNRLRGVTPAPTPAAAPVRTGPVTFGDFSTEGLFSIDSGVGRIGDSGAFPAGFDYTLEGVR
jgi:hypothetical protein